MKQVLYLICLLGLLANGLTAQPTTKHRVIILTDIEADPDDTQSLVRLLLYANEIDIQAIVATTSCWKRTSIAPASIHKVIDAYAKVQANLSAHQTGYPSAQDLTRRVKNGLPKYGMLGVGEGQDSEGSDFILTELEQDDERPLWISVWGGVNTLAQTLYKIKDIKSADEAARLIAKLRVYTISDQDDSGVWIRKNFPDLFYIVSPGDDYGKATWSAINMKVDGINNETISNSWIATHIQQDHGPLGAVYPDVAWGVEGDTPAFLSLIPTGLHDAEHPEWGGWAGRYELYTPDFKTQTRGGSGVPFEAETRPIWTNAVDTYFPYHFREYGRAFKKDTVSFSSNKVTLWRWRDDFQHDFAARMDWCVAAYEDANHPPVPVLAHAEELTVQSGEGFHLDASPSTDPDGDNLGFLWYHYPEASSYRQHIKLGAENIHTVHVTAPEVEKHETAHFILEVIDKGVPSLKRYKRVIVHFEPK